MKKLVANRVPPGDRSVMIDYQSDNIYGSVTDCLNQVYLVHEITKFFIDAKKGEIYIEDGVEKPQPIKKYTLYGEEI